MAKGFIKLLAERYVSPDKIFQLGRQLKISEQLFLQSLIYTQMIEALKQTLSSYYRNPQHREDLRQALLKTLEQLQENIWILALMPELPPGSFRDLVLQEALKINHSGDFLGVLGYYASRNQLALFQSYPLVQLNGEKLADLLTPFIA